MKITSAWFWYFLESTTLYILELLICICIHTDTHRHRHTHTHTQNQIFEMDNHKMSDSIKILKVIREKPSCRKQKEKIHYQRDTWFYKTKTGLTKRSLLENINKGCSHILRTNTGVSHSLWDRAKDHIPALLLLSFVPLGKFLNIWTTVTTSVYQG